MSKARDLANFGDDISDGVISAALNGDGSALTGLSAGPTEVVSSGTASNVALIDFTSLDFVTYNYRFVLHNCLAHSNYLYLRLAVSNDNLSTFINLKAGAMDVSFASTSVGSTNYALASPVTLSSASLSTYAPSMFELNLSCGSSGSYKMFRCFTGAITYDAFGNSRYTYGAAASDPLYNVSAPNSFRVLMSSGNISSDWTLYRMVKS